MAAAKKNKSDKEKNPKKIRCPHCGTKISRKSKFCRECGYRIPSAESDGAKAESSDSVNIAVEETDYDDVIVAPRCTVKSSIVQSDDIPAQKPADIVVGPTVVSHGVGVRTSSLSANNGPRIQMPSHMEILGWSLANPSHYVEAHAQPSESVDHEAPLAAADKGEHEGRHLLTPDEYLRYYINVPGEKRDALCYPEMYQALYKEYMTPGIYATGHEWREDATGWQGRWQVWTETSLEFGEKPQNVWMEPTPMSRRSRNSHTPGYGMPRSFKVLLLLGIATILLLIIVILLSTPIG